MDEIIDYPVLTLFDACLNVCVKQPHLALLNPQHVCSDSDSLEFDDEFENHVDINGFQESMELKCEYFLPHQISEKLFQLMAKNHPEQSLYMFIDTSKCHLTRLNLKSSETMHFLQDQRLLSKLFLHPIRELNLSGQQQIECSALMNLRYCANTLKDLDLSYVQSLHKCCVLKDLRKLERLNVQGTDIGYKKHHMQDIGELPSLKCLNLSETGIDNESLLDIQPLSRTLNSLSLFNCNALTDMYVLKTVLESFHNLVYLDISKELDQDNTDFDLDQDNSCSNIYDLMKVGAQLPNLMYLDVSGTRDMKSDDLDPFRQRGRNLLFLGLVETGLSYSSNLPADEVTGEKNEEQLLKTLEVYGSRAKYISTALRRLFSLASSKSCTQYKRCLRLILKSMKTFDCSSTIHIASTASLYHLTREDLPFSVCSDSQLRRDVIAVLLDSMENMESVLQLQKNICLTLCNFKIPSTVDVQYIRLADLLLVALQKHRDDYLRRVAIMLFNAIVCQNAGDQKKEIGLQGGIGTILKIISEKVESQEGDSLLETCWSSLWNITDETPENCEDFLRSDGMVYFVKCLQLFPYAFGLHRNMMGLMGNVAEVQRLRCFLMSEEYLKLFVSLLNIDHYGLEVSYNSAGLLSHILSDGENAWTVQNITRQQCMDKIIDSINRWDINATRNINYRSFKPILSLLACHDAPAAQYWACWALANLTKMYPSKYCKLVDEEHGREMLSPIIESHEASDQIRRLAMIVIENCDNDSSR